jgi:hypothetical protein
VTGDAIVSPAGLGELSGTLHGDATELLRPTLRVSEDGEVDLDFEVGLSHVSVYVTAGATTVRCGAVTLVVSRDRALLAVGCSIDAGAYGHRVLYNDLLLLDPPDKEDPKA